jgi:hypothetical protein
MPETVIVRSGDGFRTYSGWVVARTAETLLFAVVGKPGTEPSAVIIPLVDLLTETPAA